MEYHCQHCHSNLDGGDIFEHFMKVYNDTIKAVYAAKQYGWSETDKVHFKKTIIVQPDRGRQWTVCQDCGKKDPLKTDHLTE